MFGKHFSSMYEGSMVGSGAAVFAVMGYVIANWKPDKEVGGQIRLNTTILAAIFGEEESVIQAAIDFLCSPDPQSTTPDEGGRRLIKIGQFDYRVVNAAKYQAIRDEEEKREANRIRQKNFRHKSKPSPGETTYVKAYEAGASEAELAKLSCGLGPDCP